MNPNYLAKFQHLKFNTKCAKKLNVQPPRTIFEIVRDVKKRRYLSGYPEQNIKWKTRNLKGMCLLIQAYLETFPCVFKAGDCIIEKVTVDNVKTEPPKEENKVG